MPPSTNSRTRVLLPLGLTGFYLFVACFWQNLRFFDESHYLAMGSSVKLSALLTALSTGPLYSLWYRVLGAACPNPIWLYFLSWGILVAIVALLPSVMRVRGAWLYTAILVGIPFFNIWPYVSLFAAAFFAFGVCLLLQSELSLFSSTVLACILCFLVAFARPEYAYGVFIAAAAAVAVFLISLRRNSGNLLDIVKLVLVLGLAVIMLTAIKHSDMSRSGGAFAQHVNLRAAAAGLLGDQDPWISSYAYTAYHVGPNPSIMDFLRGNPKLFSLQLLRNLLDKTSVLFLLLLGIAGFGPSISGSNARLRVAGLFLLLISIPAVAADLIIYPDLHYSSVVFPALLLVLIQLVRGRWVSEPRVPLVLSLGITVILITNIAGRSLRLHKVSDHSGLLTVQCLRALDSDALRDASIFDPVGIDDVYFRTPKRSTSVVKFTDWAAFQHWVSQTRPAWILIYPDVLTQYKVSSQQVDGFLQRDAHYSVHPCPAETRLTVYTAPW